MLEMLTQLIFKSESSVYPHEMVGRQTSFFVLDTDIMEFTNVCGKIIVTEESLMGNV